VSAAERGLVPFNGYSSIKHTLDNRTRSLSRTQPLHLRNTSVWRRGHGVYKLRWTMPDEDPVSVEIIHQREGVDHLYLFDDDFNALDGVTRLDTAENPSQ